jgi:hypothetical protein
MRYIFVIFVALFIWSASNTSNAQVRFGINYNLDNQPAWGPTGYDYVENYYLPDLDVYYNVPQHRYYYNERGRWVSSSYLPYRYRGYDLYNSYKVVVNDREPWQNNEKYRNEYSGYRGQHDQVAIRNSRDPKYFQNKYHPEHKNWVKEHQQNNGNRNGYQKNNNGNNKSYQKDNNGRKSNNNNGVKKDNNDKKRDNNNNDKKDIKHKG